MAKQKQEKAETDTGVTETLKADTPIVVKIKPGTAAEKSMKFVLPENMLEQSVRDVITYSKGLGIEEGLKREDSRIQERLGVEMKAEYGISVNGVAIKGDEKIGDYIKDAATAAGTKYKQVEIIIASKQQGAGLELRVYQK